MTWKPDGNQEMLVIRCPKCKVGNGFLLTGPAYEGPFRCWKCKAIFIVTIENRELKSCRPVSEEEFEKYEK